MIIPAKNAFYGYCAKALCKKCETIIESQRPGDFVRCSCGAIAVDTDRWDHSMHRFIGNPEDIENLRNQPCACPKCTKAL